MHDIIIYKTFTNRDDIFENKIEKFNLSINLDDEHKIIEYTLDKDTSALHNWIKMGAPKNLNRNDISILYAHSQPKVKSWHTDDSNIDITLNPHEVKIYIIA